MDAFNKLAGTHLPIRARDARYVLESARGALFVLLFALLTGCHGGVDTDLLEREMRLQEDRIYELEDYLVDCQNVARHYRKENKELRRRLGLKQGSDPTAENSTPGQIRRTPTDPERTVTPDTIPDEVPSLPTIEGIENGEPGVIEPDLSADGRTGDLVPPPMPTTVGESVGASELESEELPIPLSMEASGPLDRIVVQKLLGAARPPAPEGLLLRTVIEPRSPDGLPVRASGDISLMILDPLKSGPDSKIARWDFAAEDAGSHWRRTGLGSGLHFDLPLPAAIENRTYELWARLVATDGEKYLASVEFEANPNRTWDGPSESSTATENLAPAWQPGKAPVAAQPTYRRAQQRPKWSPYR